MTTTGGTTAPPTFYLTLERPDGVSDAAWEFIEATQQRLARAIEFRDYPQALGAAKELVESVAKTVLTTRGQVVAKNIEFPDCITAAHKSLERLPGPGLNTEQTLRNLAQGAKTIATQLGSIRNSHGTGHGRVAQPDVFDEMLHLCVDGALIWSRWALRRLGVLAFGLPDPLIRDLELGQVFYSGDLAERLRAADLANQEDAVQRRIAVAVAQRAMRRTWVVRQDGVQSCAESDDVTAWPLAYRAALFEGLFIAPTGRVTVDEWSAEWASRVIAPLKQEQVAEAIQSLRAKIQGTVSGEALNDPFAGDHAIEEILKRSSRYLPESTRDAWIKLARQVAVAATEG